MFSSGGGCWESSEAGARRWQGAPRAARGRSAAAAGGSSDPARRLRQLRHTSEQLRAPAQCRGAGTAPALP